MVAISGIGLPHHSSAYNLTREEFLSRYPEVYYLDETDLAGLSSYLRERRWINSSETIQRAQKAGEGNMNCTLRVSTSHRTCILKQARPWVEKYPHIAAPWDRSLVEGAFYQTIAAHPMLARKMPQLFGLDECSHILMLEDLGVAKDFTFLYRGGKLAVAPFEELAEYLSRLHSAFLDSAFKEKFANRAMRELNHQHIFQIPLLENNSLNLDGITPGLQEIANRLKKNLAFCEIVSRLGGVYLATGRALLHGDFFPGSWLSASDGVRVIDPEFSFYGPPEFDVGVWVANLYLSNQKQELIERLWQLYQPPPSFDRLQALQFAGVEIMRRLIGVAQLPLQQGLQERVKLLELAQKLVLHPDSPH